MFKWFRGFMLAITLLSVLGAGADEPDAPLPAVKPEAAAPIPAPTPPVKTFNIFEYRVEGNTRLTNISIEKAVYPYLGEGKTIKDVEAARANLEKVYHDNGYLTALVNIPQQKVDENVVTLKVVEAPVGKLRIVGSHYYSLGVIRDAVPGLAEGKVPDFNEVQKELTGLNRNAGRQVTPVLKASDTPGKVDVELQVKDELPLHASIELNNHYSANTSHLRSAGSVRYDNLFQQSHSINFQYQVTPEDTSDVQVYSLSYVIPTASGAAWAFYGVHSNSNVAAVGDLSVVGNGDVVGLRLVSPLPGGDSSFYHSLSGGADYKDFKQDVSLQGSDRIQSPIRYLPFSAQYSATWLDKMGQDAAKQDSAQSLSSTTLDVGLTFVIPGLASDSIQFARKRFGASSSFLLLRPGVRRRQALPAGWSLIGRLDGQVSSGPLVSNEEFIAGGSDSVRGYVEGEFLGDEGIHSSLEIHTPSLLGGFDSRITSSYLLAFGEGAYLRVRDPLPGQQSHFILGSVGFGFRFKAIGFDIDLDGAHVLQGGPNTKSGDNRGLFRVNYGF